MFKNLVFDWAESIALSLLLIGIIIGMFFTGWKIYAIALITGAMFAKYLLRTTNYFWALLLPFGFGLGMIIGNLNLLIVLPYILGIYGGIRIHKHIRSIDY